MKKKILITTVSPPVQNIGGPGNFAPKLFKYLYKFISEKKDYISKYEVLGMFNDVIVERPEEITYLDNLLDPKILKLKYKIKSKIKNVLLKSPTLFIKILKYHAKKRQEKILKLTNNKNISLIHAHCFESVKVWTEKDIKIVFTNHYKGSLYNEYIRHLPGFKNDIFKEYFLKIERDAIKRANLITFPSNSAKDLLISDFPDMANIIENKSKIIYSGIEDLLPRNVEHKSYFSLKNRNLVLNIANHIPAKGIDITIKVFKDLLRINPNLKLVNIGMYGPETDKLKKLVERLNIVDNVSFRGGVSHNELLSLIKESIAIIHTPTQFVLDLVVLEAMSLLTPIIALDSIGLREVLGDYHPLYVKINRDRNETSLCFNPEILTNIDELYKVAENSRNRFIELFTVEKMCNNYISVYKELI
jgi:glycosyltransferase involved in cell wall biosynthesis